MAGTNPEQINALLENLSDGFFTLNTDWQFTYLNRKAEELLKTDRGSLLGKNKWQVFPERTNSLAYNMYHRALTEQTAVHFEDFYPSLDAWFDIRVYPAPQGLLVYLHDITQTKLVENEIKNLTLRSDFDLDFRETSSANEETATKLDLQTQIVNNMAEGVCVVRAADSLILYANPTFEKMFGYGPGELDNKPVTILNYGGEFTRENETATEVIAQIMEAGVATYEVYNIKKDGTPFWCRATTSRFEHPSYGTVLVAVQQDIDAYRQTQDALRQSEERFTKLFKAAPVAMVLSRFSDGLFVDVNRRFEEVTGYSRADAIGRTSTELVKFAAVVRTSGLEELTFKGHVRNYEADIQIKNRLVRRVLASSELVTIGDAQYILTAFDDITERKLLEKALQQSEALYRSLVRNLPDSAVIVFNHELRYLVAEGSALNKNGFKRELVEGKTLFEVLSPADVARLLPYYQAALAGIEHTFEDYYDDRIYLVRATPIKDESGNILAGMLLSQDITALKRSEKILANEKERLNVTLQSIGDGVITTDTDGKITLVNRVAEELTGWSYSAAVGRPITEVLKLVHEVGRSPLPNLVLEAVKNNSILTLEANTVLVARDNTERVVTDSVAPIRDQNNSVIGAVMVFRDYTKEQKLEQELLKNSKLEALGILAGGIAHDFNNLLTAILANLTLARYSLEPTHKISELLEEAEKALARSTALTQQLLTFAKGGSPVKKVVRLNRLALETTRFVLHGSNVKCEFNLPADLAPVNVDAGQISQVIQNLVLNAREAMLDGGTIWVEAENSSAEPTLTASPVSKNYVRLSISDAGSGIAPENLVKIFDPYFTTKSGGSGLGLAVCYSVIKKHGGEITVSSQLGKGTTFTIWLPAATEVNLNEPSKSQTISTGHGRVLIMDDEEMLRRAGVKILNRLGYNAVAAKDGQEAVAMYREAQLRGAPFDVVLLDLTIPGGMGGKQTIARLLELDPQVKAIVCSGYSSDPIMANYHEYGFVGVLNKPYQLEDLSNLLARLLKPTDPTA